MGLEFDKTKDAETHGEEQVFGNYLKARGLKFTPARRQLLRAIVSIHDHFTAEQLLDRLRHTGIPASKATVYRTLAVMLACDCPESAVPALRRLFDAALADQTMPLIRAGVHHGPAIEDSKDFFGASVNLAARVAAQAAGGQLLATTAVAVAARDAGEVVTHVGAVTLRNIPGPVDLYAIELQAGSEISVDPVCAMKVPTTGPSVIHLKYGDRDIWFCGLPCVARYAASPDRFQ